MSEELKTYDFPVDHGDFTNTIELFYLKSEADKLIEELKAIRKRLEEANTNLEKRNDSIYNEWKVLFEKSRELKKQVHDYAQGLYVMQAKAENEARRHKYKRCLAMAKWCENEEKRLEAIAPIFDTDKECWEYNSDYWFKWRRRWLELAEKFKEANDGND